MNSRKQWVKAVNLSAVLGYLAVVAPPSLLAMNPHAIVGMAVFGLPIAWMVSWIVVAPILWRLMQKRISLAKAAAWGATVAFSLASISIVAGRYLGWRRSIDPNAYSQIGGGDYVRSIDGILTPYGWYRLGVETLLFVLAGALIAILLRVVVGEPEHAKAAE
jgi:tetrahydromethanopterin S-methyltransferase subunit E